MPPLPNVHVLHAHDLPLLFDAAAIAGLSELLLAQHEVTSDAPPLLGHLYRFVCDALISRTMSVVSVRRPSQELTCHGAAPRRTASSARAADGPRRLLDPGRNGRILEVKEVYEHMSGYPARELIGMHVAHPQAIEDAQGLESRRQKLFRVGHAYAVEVSITWDPPSLGDYVFTATAPNESSPPRRNACCSRHRRCRPWAS